MQGWLSGSLVMMLSKNYGMFWFETQPCTPEQLEKISAATDHTVCVCMDLIVVIAVIVLCVLILILWVTGRVASG